MNLKTKYMGLDLKTPLIVGASPLTSDEKKLKSCQNYGAGAVVLRSLFQEEIEGGIEAMQDYSAYMHTEAADYLASMGTQQAVSSYLELIKKAKDTVSIPVIASINCHSADWWTDTAQKIEKAGADALELNVSVFPVYDSQTSEEIENRVLDIVRTAREAVKMPIAVKIGPYFTSVGHLIAEIEALGANAVVMFNRFYRVDVDVEKRKIISGKSSSTQDELAPTLRWIAIEAPRRRFDIAASCGIHTGRDAAKAILAGADVFQMVSALIRHGIPHIATVLDELSDIMDKQGFDSIDHMQGSLLKGDDKQEEKLSRLQYIMSLKGI
ncbi:dihydroorotate dehydrogenase-like protein [Spirochaetia bacterium 38H-sp]|uniref:Dihydroorotate dehydrogenase-like protein n=1 Tax=Rarispira pelagica TaxID=3141764 RepID=A0ABU9UCM4_9SPIR